MYFTFGDRFTTIPFSKVDWVWEIIPDDECKKWQISLKLKGGPEEYTHSMYGPEDTAIGVQEMEAYRNYILDLPVQGE